MFLLRRYDGVWETYKHLKMVELQQERGGLSREGYMSVKLRQRPMNEWLIRPGGTAEGFRDTGQI